MLGRADVGRVYSMPEDVCRSTTNETNLLRVAGQLECPSACLECGSGDDSGSFTAQFWSHTYAHYMCCGSRLRESHSVMPTSCMTPFTGKTNLSFKSVDKLIFVMQMLATKPALGEKECATMPATMVH